MLSVNVKISGTEKELAKLKKLGVELKNFRSAFILIGTRLTTYYSNEVFASQGGILGHRWDKLNPVYARRKAKGYAGRGVLEKTGDMRNEFRFDAFNDGVVISNSAPYFKYHQSTEPRTVMPYRPMMAVNKDVRNIVKQVIEEDIRRKVAAA